MSARSDARTTDERLVDDLPEADRPRIRRIVVGSLSAGFVAALVLPFVPAGSVDENYSTGMVLLGFALGWAMLAVLSMRRSDQPQRWAVVPAVFMGASGCAALVVPNGFLDALGWIWPPALLAMTIWVYAQARRDLRTRARWWSLNPVLAVLVLVSIGGAYETLSRATEPSSEMHGDLIGVGPYRLHLECTGSGSPTVILEPGGGAAATTMAWIAPGVARDTRVCVYDRAGRGWSDAAQTPPDATQIAIDLHTLLDRAHVPGPYVLAGHSFGGLYVMTYAERYPDQVAGLVLIDSTAPKSSPVSARGHGYSVLKHASSLVSTTARLGVGRLIAATSFGGLPPHARDEARASSATAKEMSSFLDEFGVANRSEAEAGRLTSLDGKPLVVLTAERGNLPGWTTSQDRMATLSTNSVHRVVPGATHDSLMENPAHAAAVVRAIHDVLVSLRSGDQLDAR